MRRAESNRYSCHRATTGARHEKERWVAAALTKEVGSYGSTIVRLRLRLAE